MENFFYSERFYRDISDLVIDFEEDEDEIKINELKDDWCITVELSTLEPMFSLDAGYLEGLIYSDNEDRYPEDMDYEEPLIKALKACVDFEKLNAMIPKFYYPNNTFSTITKNDLIEYLKKMNMKNIIENEIKFCEEIDCEKNQHGRYIYHSSNGNSHMSLPYTLQEYKQYLIDNKIVIDSTHSFAGGNKNEKTKEVLKKTISELISKSVDTPITDAYNAGYVRGLHEAVHILDKIIFEVDAKK